MSKLQGRFAASRIRRLPVCRRASVRMLGASKFSRRASLRLLGASNFIAELSCDCSELQISSPSFAAIARSFKFHRRASLRLLGTPNFVAGLGCDCLAIQMSSRGNRRDMASGHILNPNFHLLETIVK